ncbi:BTB/POZ domain-containing protein POB1 [Acorus calamus]|uniref:BTB/POZ domain-containing protein POB1 n=1 Tax=Acorus calamus TaxID=4465 RepID=A0AAV9EWR6_ACOCL|nr:BTB/POZ domain-containing protein POB1 [Acorus calamus]
MDQLENEDNDDGTFELAFNNPYFSDCVFKIEVIIGSDIDKAYAMWGNDDIQVPSEDDVYDIVMKWARTQFPTVQERHAVLGSYVTRIMRLPYMSNEKLREILPCDDLDREFVKHVWVEKEKRRVG